MRKKVTKKYLTEKCRFILYNYDEGEIINEEDSIFLLSVFRNHEHWEIKKGCGVSKISVMATTYYNNRCFMLTRHDGTTTDISFINAITNKTPKQNIYKACRSAVQPTIKAFKESINFSNLYCPFNGEKLTYKTTHIDHYELSFKDLFDLWLSYYSIIDLGKKINKTTDNNIDTYFIDDDVREDFIQFHNLNTHLRPVSIQANLSILKRVK